MSSKTKLLIITGLVIILWIGSGIIIYFTFDNWSDRGTFGDLFGFINSLFSGLALAGLIFTTFTNREDLVNQRSEIELNRKELIKSRKVQEKTEKAQEEQVMQMKLSTKLNGLQTLINYFTDQINNPNNSEEKILLAREKRREAIAEIDDIIERLGDSDIELI